MRIEVNPIAGVEPAIGFLIQAMNREKALGRASLMANPPVSHDLRRAWANYHLVEKEVSVRVMMAIGGWSSYDAIEPYLTQPSSEKIGAELNMLS